LFFIFLCFTIQLLENTKLPALFCEIKLTQRKDAPEKFDVWVIATFCNLEQIIGGRGIDSTV
jgi:hypothetical protein